MAAFDASIKRTLPFQDDLKDHREHCSVDPGRLASIGRAVGHQVRVKLNGEQYGLYTVSEAQPEDPDNIVRMGRAGRLRLGTPDEFDAVVDAQVPHPTFSERKARDNSEFIERLADDGRQRGLITIAPHGGDIEPRTDRQAERVASRLRDLAVSSWRCKGFKDDGGAFARWHITSTDLNEASFPRLSSVFARGFTYAVAFHGFDDPELLLTGDILVGGGALPELKEELVAEIKGMVGPDLVVRVPAANEKFGGDDARNIVNRLAAPDADGIRSGIQIEQSPDARSDARWRAIADAVAGVYRARLRPVPATY
jgi:phage replication-related protein YjqB (UPF0714/DUF867 family)